MTLSFSLPGRLLMQRLCSVFFFLLVVCASSFPQDSTIKIERIDIWGNLRIPETIICSYIQSVPGDPYDEKRLEADLQSLFRYKFLENISIETKELDLMRARRAPWSAAA